MIYGNTEGQGWRKQSAKIENVKIFGIEDNFKTSKYPAAVNTKNVNRDYAETIKAHGQCRKGTGHDNFLNGRVVRFDLTFSNKTWIELQRYHFIDFVSSQLTMQRISKMHIRNMCNEYVDERIVCICEEIREKYNRTKNDEDYLRLLYNIQAGFELTARMTTNYRQLKTIYEQRKNHRLPEWRKFCEWIETLPYSELITGGQK